MDELARSGLDGPDGPETLDRQSDEPGPLRQSKLPPAKKPLPGKWQDAYVTADGSSRAVAPLKRGDVRGAETLWVNTGTLCNIACIGCYIESSPTNDRLVYIKRDEVAAALDDAEGRRWPLREIGFTGGEPFLNPEMNGLLEEALARDLSALVLTNAMRPMMRPKVQKGLLDLLARFGDRMTLRVSFDHYTAERHDEERGKGSFERALIGARWLAEQGFSMSVAGRSIWGETEAEARAGFGALFEREGLPVAADDPGQLVIFPEMKPEADPPEITTACWGILGKTPESVMCASARMLVKRKGAERPAYLACTLIPYDTAFELGSTAREAEKAVPLKHKYCATFCVLGGASCSG